MRSKLQDIVKSDIDKKQMAGDDFNAFILTQVEGNSSKN